MSLKCLPKFTKSRANQKYEKKTNQLYILLGVTIPMDTGKSKAR